MIFTRAGVRYRVVVGGCYVVVVVVARDFGDYWAVGLDGETL